MEILVGSQENRDLTNTYAFCWGGVAVGVILMSLGRSLGMKGLNGSLVMFSVLVEFPKSIGAIFIP